MIYLQNFCRFVSLFLPQSRTTTAATIRAWGIRPMMADALAYRLSSMPGTPSCHFLPLRGRKATKGDIIPLVLMRHFPFGTTHPITRDLAMPQFWYFRVAGRC